MVEDIVGGSETSHTASYVLHRSLKKISNDICICTHSIVTILIHCLLAVVSHIYCKYLVA